MDKQRVITELERAREYVNRGWCQGSLAQDAHGRQLTSLDPAAVAWCALGALEKADAGGRSDTIEAFRAVIPRAPGSDWVSIAGWNNHPARTQAQVSDAFGEAIRRVREAHPS